MAERKHIAAALMLILYLSLLAAPVISDGPEDDENDRISKEGKHWKHKKSRATAIDATEFGATVTGTLELSFDTIGIKYTDYDYFVLVPGDGRPSMVLIFNKGSVESTLYIDSDAKELLDKKDSEIELIGASSLSIKKTDIKPTGDADIYAISIKEKHGKSDLKESLESELATGSKIIYAELSSPDSVTKSSIVIIKKPKKIGIFDIKSINDFMLWINLKFNMNLDNDEKEIMQEGILASLEKTVEDNTSPPADAGTEAQQVISDNTCVAVE